MEDYKKKYEDALSRAKVINPGTADYEVAVKIFPELKESEDERIRKALIHLISEQDGFLTAIDGISVKDILAWLEKQGENIENVLTKVGLKLYKDGNKWCILLGDNIQEGVCGFGDTIDDALFEFLKELVEKQSEQINIANKEYWRGYREGKQEIIDKYSDLKKQSNTDNIIERAKTEKQRVLVSETNGDANIDWNTRSLEDARRLLMCGLQFINTELEKQDKYKVKPKFKVGDWITIDNPCQIISIDGNYIVQYCDDEKTREISKKFCESKFHLWTIQDAKDGDVLVKDSCIFILKEMLDGFPAVTTYCALFNNDNGEFYISEPLYSDMGSTRPATKEQRDLLFSKMKEAGYEWDAEKKELKKIEQKSA